MTGEVQLARERFARGFNCAQSILVAFGDGVMISEDVALQLAAPFGAGMGRAGATCGALTGAIMVLGLHYANSRPEDKNEIYALTREFLERFRQRHGTIICRELVGQDISTPEGLKAAREGNVFGTLCASIVEETARALDQFIREHPGK